MTKTKKNYGIYDYLKDNEKPVTDHYRAYITDMFDLKNPQQILDDVFAKNAKLKRECCGNINGAEYSGDYFNDKQSIIAKQLLKIFVDKQLVKHGRIENYQELDNYGDTIKEICLQLIQEKVDEAKDYSNKVNDLDKQQRAKDSERNESLSEAQKLMSRIEKAEERLSKAPVPKDPKEFERRKEELDKLNKMKKDVIESYKQKKEQIDKEVVTLQEEKNQAYKQNQFKRNTTVQDVDKFYSSVISKVDIKEKLSAKRQEHVFTISHDNIGSADKRQMIDAEGRYENIGLKKELVKIINSIVGEAEIRGTERGFSRPSRCSHFIKNAFLPVYKSHKQRKQPFFFIDSSGSMDGDCGKFDSVTTAIAALLRDYNRKISELRPRYFHFNHCPAQEFNIKNTLPRANGGNNMGFLKGLSDKGVNVVITDGGFGCSDYMLMKGWLLKHKNVIIHWICNESGMVKNLEEACNKNKNHHVHYVQFVGK